jgi:predicted dehydrogenase
MSTSSTLPRIIFIGAGSQANAYAGPITRQKLGTIIAVADPLPYKRQDFGRRHIWGSRTPHDSEQWPNWEAWVSAESKRVERSVDAVFICVLDELHLPVIRAIAKLGVHVMCEKPLATNLADCIAVLGTMERAWEELGKRTIFGLGHVLRYSPQNMLLRRLVRDERLLGDVVSVEHTEPVGWWHMAHSFVRYVDQQDERS